MSFLSVFYITLFGGGGVLTGLVDKLPHILCRVMHYSFSDVDSTCFPDFSVSVSFVLPIYFIFCSFSVLPILYVSFLVVDISYSFNQFSYLICSFSLAEFRFCTGLVCVIIL